MLRATVAGCVPPNLSLVPNDAVGRPASLQQAPPTQLITSQGSLAEVACNQDADMDRNLAVVQCDSCRASSLNFS